MIGSVGNSPLFSNRVKAIVGLPADDRFDRGDEVHFSGTLVRFDRLVRAIYVADAECTKPQAASIRH